MNSICELLRQETVHIYWVDPIMSKMLRSRRDSTDTKRVQVSFSDVPCRKKTSPIPISNKTQGLIGGDLTLLEVKQ